VEEGYSIKEQSKLFADGGNVEQGLFVFVECAGAPHRWFAAKIAQSDVKKLDSSDKWDVACCSERHDLSAPKDVRCIKLQTSPDSSSRDAAYSRSHELHVCRTCSTVSRNDRKLISTYRTGTIL
jgi:hypothetical protein